MKLNVETNINDVIQQLADAGGELQDKVVDAVNETALNIESKAKQNVTVDTGRLRSSITTFQVEDPTKPFAEVIVNARYAPYVEFGTKSKTKVPSGLEGVAQQFKGGGGSFSDLLSNIRQWCKNKGIDEDAAYPIAVKIAREGVRAQPFFFPAVADERAKFVRKLKKITSDLN